MIKEKIFTLLFTLLVPFLLAAQSPGEKLFLSNQPVKAIPVLEQELNTPIVDPTAYNYLGIAYYQVGEYAKSVQVFEKGLNASGTDKKILAFNAGNSSFAAGDFSKADEYYSLAIAADSTYAAPVLNRANSLLRQNKLEDSLSDYENFLKIAPEDDQYEKVNQLVGLLKTEIQKQKDQAEQSAAEETRIKAEQSKIAAAKAQQEQEAAEQKAAAEAEQKKIAEQKAAEETARRRKLLEDVASSLQDTDSTNVSAGAADVMTYDGESELD